MKRSKNEFEHFPVFLKNRKKYNDKNIFRNVWKEVADHLDFNENSDFLILTEFQIHSQTIFSSVNVHNCFRPI